MDNQILDIVLGLLLVYLVLALLVTQLQETFFGTWGKSRQRTLHDMLEEALGREGDVKARLLANPAIAALYQGPQAKEGLRTTGPSAIPNDLFARALLVALNNDKGNHPNVRFATPRLFIDRKAVDQETVWGVLRTLLPGVEGNWAQFEAAIAKWWDQIGERATGWYQRKAQRRIFWLALAVAGLFNASTFQLVERFSGDTAARQAFASLAQRVAATFGAGGAGAAGAAPGPAAMATSSPAEAPVRAELALERAHARMAEQFFGRQRSLASFEPKRQEVLSTDENTIKACAGARLKPAAKPAAGNGEGGTGKNEVWWLSDARTWLQLLPTLRKSIKEARLPERFDAEQSAGRAPRAEVLENAYLCIGNLVGWVTTAASASSDATAATSLQAAAADLNQAADALLEMLESRRTGIVVRELFRADPNAFAECAGMPGMSRDRLAGCVASASNGSLNLPLGWTGRNIRLAFCRVDVLPVTSEQGSDCLRNDVVFEGNAGLGIKRLVLRGTSWLDAAWLVLGFVVTAFFISLGAPFWFDVLGRVVKLRAAGARPEAMADKAPPQTLPVDAAPGGPGGAGGGLVREPFSDARNEFERILTASDKVSLQQLIGASPTGILDTATRSALVQRARDLKIELPEVDQLSLLAFTRITGSLPAALEEAHQAQTVETTAVPSLTALAARLAAALALPAASGADDQRALAVLYTYKSERSKREAGQSLRELALCQAAGAGALADADAVAAATRSALQQATVVAGEGALPAFPREPAPWLDWALGELGQSQRNATTRAGSNPRVVNYLEAGGLTGDIGDETDWCAGFVCWVLARRNGEPGVQALPARPAIDPLRARSWMDWGRERPRNEAQAGDIVVVHPSGDPAVHHVAFLLERQGDLLWVIGGNQGQAQGLKRGVTVTSFPSAHVAGVRWHG